MADIDYSALAQQFGAIPPQTLTQQVQSQVNAPWAGLPPREANDMKQKVYEDSQRRINALRDVINKGEPILNDLNRFGQLNRESSTGSLWQNLTNSPLFHNAQTNEMNKIQARIAPSQRIQGSGSSSDIDVALMMKGLPSTSDTGNVNKAVREDYQRQYNYALAKSTFLEDYLNKHGHLNGADKAWMTEKNKYLDLKNNNALKPNATADEALIQQYLPK